jgi:lactate dehydrogenase-like 2-hydroxyacid dehydrogenase
VFIDADRFAGTVVDKIDLRQAQEHGLAVTHFELYLAAATDDVFGRNAINSLRSRA